MLRLILAAIILLAVAWYMAHDNGPRPDIVKEQREDLQEAKDTAEFADKVQATQATETDALRDAAMGKPAQGDAAP